MPTQTQLEIEIWWRLEFVPPALRAMLAKVRLAYGLPSGNIGAKGNTAHLKGRHRSRNWCLNSIWCTDRSYGTTDPRDKSGNGDWIRAFDITFLDDQDLFAVSHRIDEAVRAGRLPGMAEWFGTFNGTKVVGWFEGNAASSDSSHLHHFHGGLWTNYANDPATLSLLGELITGEEDMALTPEQNQKLTDLWYNWFINDSVDRPDTADSGRLRAVETAVATIETQVDQILALLTTGVSIPAEVTVSDASVQAIATAVADEDHARSAE